MKITKSNYRIQWTDSGLDFCLLIRRTEPLNTCQIRMLYFACFPKFCFPCWKTIVSGIVCDIYNKLAAIRQRWLRFMFTLLNNFFQRRKTHKFGNKVFVYGRDGIDSSRKKIPQTIWKITVAADQQLINILQSKPDTTLLKGLTASSFLEVKVVIKCRQVKQIGFVNNILISLLKLLLFQMVL